MKVATITADATKRSATFREIAAIIIGTFVLLGQVYQTGQTSRLQIELARIAKEMPPERFPAPRISP